MRYRPLGDSGLMVSVTGLGCNNFGRRLDLGATRAVVHAALEAGVTLLDTSDTYGNGGGSEELRCSSAMPRPRSCPPPAAA
jgi:aryl-alcohol dehydrogenase-like predicted oxidoreductase